MNQNASTSTFKQAQELANKGEFAEALQRYQMFYQSAEGNPALLGVALSLALRSWARLGDKYEPARIALRELRDRKVEMLNNGATDKGIFEEVESINHVLGQSDQTSRLFTTIALTNRPFAERCFRAALPALVQNGEFSVARTFISSPSTTLDRIISRYLSNISPEDISDSRIEDSIYTIFVEDVANLLSVLVAAGEGQSACVLLQKASDSTSRPSAQQQIKEEVCNRTRLPWP